MGALRLLMLVVPTLYCTSIGLMLFYLPSLQHRISHLSNLDTGSPRPPPIHDHVLIARMAYERCANLSRQLRAKNGNLLRFAPIPDTTVTVLSAYRDDRLPKHAFIRLLVLLGGPASRFQLYCHLPLSPQRMLSMPATLYQFNENHNMQYGGYIASCRLPDDMSQVVPLCMVRVTAKAGPSSPGAELLLESVPRPLRHNLTACIPPLFGDITPQRLVEFFELNRLLGFEHFFLYDVQNRSNTSLEQVLRHYSRKGLLTLWRWQLPVSSSNVWYRGQMLAIHHCLFANMGSSRYTAFQDLDEVFVPRQHSDLLALLRSVDKPRRHCGFRVFSAFFPAPDSQRGPSVLRSRRSASLSRLRTKCIVHPELIFEMGIHHMSKQNVEEMTPKDVHEKLVLLHHNRACDASFGMNCHSFITDDALVSRFGEALRKRLSQVVMKS